jgi:sugar lactone lactonase YvrE
MPSAPRKPDLRPSRAIPGARIELGIGASPGDDGRLPEVSVGGAPARVLFAAPDRVAVVVPKELPGGRHAVAVEGREVGPVVEVGSTLVTDVHQVDSPIFDRHGRLFVTFSGTRGEQVPVSVFRVAAGGEREPLVSGIVNPTSLALGPDGDLYVSSRFEGAVYRVKTDGSREVFATELGVACGLAFDADGVLFVGDRSGTIFRVEPDGTTRRFAALPPSIAAFHLAFGPDGALYVTAPTVNTYDHVYRVDRRGTVEVFYTGFGRPQGLAFDPGGVLHVAEALAGASGIFRFTPSRTAEQVVSGHALVGVAFDAQGNMAVASNDTVYWFGTAGRRARTGRAKPAGPM